MVRRGEDDPLHALEARRLEEVVAADDIGVVDDVPVRLDRIAAEMEDAVDAGDGAAERLDVAEVGGRHLSSGVGSATGARSERRSR